MKGIVLVFFPLLLCIIQEAKNINLMRLMLLLFGFFFPSFMLPKKFGSTKLYVSWRKISINFLIILLPYKPEFCTTWNKKQYIFVFLLLVHAMKEIKLCVSWHIVFKTCFYCFFFPFFSIVPKKPNYVPDKQHFFGLFLSLGNP